MLYRKHQDVSAQLELKYNETRLARERAAELKERATDMYTSTKNKIDRLAGRRGGTHRGVWNSWVGGPIYKISYDNLTILTTSVLEAM